MIINNACNNKCVHPHYLQSISTCCATLYQESSINVKLMAAGARGRWGSWPLGLVAAGENQHSLVNTHVGLKCSKRVAI